MHISIQEGGKNARKKLCAAVRHTTFLYRGQALSFGFFSATTTPAVMSVIGAVLITVGVIVALKKPKEST